MGSVDLGAVGQRCRVRLPVEHRELATCSGADNLLPADSSVVDLRRCLDVLDCALASLVVAGEAPRVDLAVGSDGEVIIGTGGDGDDVLGFCNLLAMVLKNWWYKNLPG